MKRLLLSFLCIASGLELGAQANECLNEVLRCEARMGRRNDSCPAGKTLMYGYKMRALTHDDEVSESKVKIYTSGANLQLFSDEAALYRNAQQAVLVLPSQKLLVVNAAMPEMNTGQSDAFAELKNSFLQSCVVEECVPLFGSRRRLVLRAGTSASPFQVARMTYDYDQDRMEVVQITVDYTDSYKLKQLVVSYAPTEWLSNYRFAEPSSFFSDKKGRLLPQFSDYEIVDNRETGNQKKRN